MLLVLISLACSTLIAAAYLTSRENSAAIGGNICEATAARWAASSGIHLAIAVLETEIDWRTQHINGELFNSMPISGGQVTVEVYDRVTGQPPTAETRYIGIVATATVGGLQQEARAYAEVPFHHNVALVDLGDFVIFTRDQLELRDDSTVARWPVAPHSVLQRPIAIGTRSTSIGAIDIQANAAMIDGVAFLPSGLSSLLLGLLNALLGKVVVLDDPIPFPNPPTPPANPDGPTPALNVDGPVTLATNATRDKIDVRSDGILTLSGNVTVAVNNEIRIRNGGRVIVDGDVRLVVHGDLTMEADSSFEVEPGSRLTMHVGGPLEMRDAYLGDLRANAVRDSSGYAPWFDLQRIQIYTIASAGEHVWEVRDNSVLKGSIYAPQAYVQLRNTSAVYGRIAARRFQMRNNAAVFYDHAFDRAPGYTALDGPLFDENGRIRTSVRNLTSVTSGTMTGAASSAELVLLFGAWEYGEISPALALDLASEEPTPRTVKVSHQMTGFGGDALEWEGSLP